MDTGKQYFDSEGNVYSIWQAVRREPDWAASRIQEGEKAIARLAELEMLSKSSALSAGYGAWISIDERLPEEIIEFVLVTRNKGAPSVMEANYVDGKFRIYRLGMNTIFIAPTHWMPLPDAP